MTVLRSRAACVGLFAFAVVAITLAPAPKTQAISTTTSLTTTRLKVTVINHDQVLYTELSVPVSATDAQIATALLAFDIDGQTMHVISSSSSAPDSLDMSVELPDSIQPGNRLLHAYDQMFPMSGVYVNLHITPRPNHDQDDWPACDVLAAASLTQAVAPGQLEECNLWLENPTPPNPGGGGTTTPPVVAEAPAPAPSPAPATKPVYAYAPPVAEPEPVASIEQPAPSVLSNTFTPAASAQAPTDIPEPKSESLSVTTATVSLLAGITSAAVIAFVVSKLGLTKPPIK